MATRLQAWLALFMIVLLAGVHALEVNSENHEETVDSTQDATGGKSWVEWAVDQANSFVDVGSLKQTASDVYDGGKKNFGSAAEYASHSFAQSQDKAADAQEKARATAGDASRQSTETYAHGIESGKNWGGNVADSANGFVTKAGETLSTSKDAVRDKANKVTSDTTDSMKQAYDGVSDHSKQTATTLQGKGGDLSATTKEYATLAGDNVAAAKDGLVDSAQSYASAASEKVGATKESTKHGSQESFESVKDKSGRLSSSAKESATVLGEKAAAARDGVLDSAAGISSQEYANTAKQQLGDTYDITKQNVMDSAAGVSDTANEYATLAGEKSTAIKDGVLDSPAAVTAQEYATAGGKKLSDTYESAKQSTSDTSAKTGENVLKAKDHTFNSASNAANFAREKSGEATDSVQQTASDAANFAREKSGKVTDSVQQYYESAAEGTKNAATNVKDTTKRGVDNGNKVAGDLSQTAKQKFDSASDTTKETYDSATDKAKHATGFVTQDEQSNGAAETSRAVQ